MSTTINIQRQAFKRDKLNILCADTHEAYQTNLCMTGHNFYSLPHESFKKWNSNYRPIPKNYFQLSNGIPTGLGIDLVLSQNKFGQFQQLANIAAKLNVPLLSLEHTLPIPAWPQNIREACKNMRGHHNVFISEYSIGQWGFLQDETVSIVHHGINTDEFKPLNDNRENRILCVVNDWINRDWCCNFQTFHRTAADLPVMVVGDTPGLSKPASSVSELISEYQKSRIFYNTSTISPVPTALMEAMSCGCAVVSTATCMIPELIQHGQNGLISNDENELRKFLLQLLENPDMAKSLGENARKTIEKRFNLEKFVYNWNEVLYKVAEMNGCQ